MPVWCMSLREVGMQPSAYSILETLSGIAGLGFKIGWGAWGEAVEVDAWAGVEGRVGWVEAVVETLPRDTLKAVSDASSSLSVSLSPNVVLL